MLLKPGMQCLKGLIVLVVTALAISQSQNQLKRRGLPSRPPANINKDQYGDCSEQERQRPTPILPEIRTGEPPRPTSENRCEGAPAKYSGVHRTHWTCAATQTEVSDRRRQERWSARGTPELPPSVERKSGAAVRSTDFVCA